MERFVTIFVSDFYHGSGVMSGGGFMGYLYGGLVPSASKGQNPMIRLLWQTCHFRLGKSKTSTENSTSRS